MMYPTFKDAIASIDNNMRHHSQPVHTERWQAIDIKNNPAAEMRELMYVEFRVPMQGFRLDYYRDQIKPNLPWADDHFEKERVSGHPINPGTTWEQWPYGLAADKHRTEDDQFSHSYAERYWPKYANLTEGGILKEVPPEKKTPISDSYAFTGNLGHHYPLTGIRYNYGDLEDVVHLLGREPLTRQAYLPVWFPEDTGAVHLERVPCTLGYHFMQRAGYFHVYYPIRSCDYLRHFRDDLYLTTRLLLWVLERLRREYPEGWAKTVPGLFMFWAGSLHCFINDWRKLYAST